MLREAAVRHGMSGCENLGLVDLDAVGIETVPAHGRSKPNVIAGDDLEGPRGVAERVMRMEGDRPGPSLRQRASDASGRGVRLQAGRESIDGELHGPLAGGGYGIKERCAGMDAENLGAMDGRCKRSRRCQDRRIGKRTKRGCAEDKDAKRDGEPDCGHGRVLNA
jgi:hypothetical protein